MSETAIKCKGCGNVAYCLISRKQTFVKCSNCGVCNNIPKGATQ